MKRGGPLQRRTPLRPGKGSLAKSASGLKRGAFAAKPRPRLRARSTGAIARLEAECDILWSQLVKLRCANRCAKTGLPGRLEAAHIFGRTSRATRWALHNGVALLKEQHAYFHDNPREFMDWVARWWPYKQLSLEQLHRQSLTLQQVSEPFLIQTRDRLRDELKAYGQRP